MISNNEPVLVAIVGMACRLPGGVNNPRELIQFLRNFGDGICEVPKDRWSSELYYHPNPSAPGKVYVNHAGFLTSDIFAFDPTPFGISPREAERMDPQQRLLLEVAWEAFEDAGLPIDTVRGSKTGVFMGGFMIDYRDITSNLENQPLIDSHVPTGVTATILSNRISYIFDLRGPSMTIDTACSSSLVATHLACQSLANGSCDQALVGGVNLMLSPVSTMLMCKGGFLSPDGRSKAFDASADGYGRGEGAAILCLKKLDRAIADHDRIYAVIHATGVNQDGKTDGMPFPSGEAQQSLCEEVLAKAKIDPALIAYVEAHGTGTRAGDPIEVKALGQVYAGQKNRKSPLQIGSIKTNIGHLEAAAGVVGLMKAALTLHQKEIFPQRSFTTLNQEIPFRDLNIEVSISSQVLSESLSYVAINSFGYGGTNAHAILGEFNSKETGVSLESMSPKIYPISAPSQAALSCIASNIADWLFAHPNISLENIEYTLTQRRAHQSEKIAIVASERTELMSALLSYANKNHDPAISIGKSHTSKKTLWVYTGMGTQWWCMGQELYAKEPIFRAIAEHIDQKFTKLAGWSILAEMLKDEKSSRMSSNEIAQPANFILQVSLTELMRHIGLQADGYLGHSVGELAAAWAAGCLTLDEAVYLTFHRSRLQQCVAGKGTMLAVGISAERAHTFIKNNVDVTIAAFNAPLSVVFAGNREDLSSIASQIESEGLFNRFLAVDVAYHSAHMEPLKVEFLEILKSILPNKPKSILFSTVTGKMVVEAVHDAHYWWKNARDPVLFQNSIQSALDDGFENFIEIGPHPVLGMAISDIIASKRAAGKTFYTLKRKTTEQKNLYLAIASAFVNGSKVVWSKNGELVNLPLYPFQRETLWKESTKSRFLRVGKEQSHPLLRSETQLPGQNWITYLPCEALSFFTDHKIQNKIIFPGAAYIEAALAVVQENKNSYDLISLSNICFENMLEISDQTHTSLCVSYIKQSGEITIHAQDIDAQWVRHAKVKTELGANFLQPTKVNLTSILNALENQAMSVDKVYEKFSKMGLEYGPQFQTIKRIAYHANGIVAELELNQENSRFIVHPSLLDGAFQSLICLMSQQDETIPIVPVKINSIRVFGPLEGKIYLVGHGKQSSLDGHFEGSFSLMDETGQVLLVLNQLICHPLVKVDAQARKEASWIYTDHWKETETQITHNNLSKIYLLGEVQEFSFLLENNSENAQHFVWFAPSSSDDTFALEATQYLLKILRNMPSESRLTVITRGAQTVIENESCRPSQTAIASLVRVLMLEHPHLNCRLIDLTEHGPYDSELIKNAIFASDSEEELAIRQGKRYLRRIVHTGGENKTRRSQREIVNVTSGCYELFVSRPGNFDSMVFVPCRMRNPEPNELEISIQYASLNFKDVMKALGMLPENVLENTYIGRELGLEASGRVVKVGSAVKDFVPGDEVVVFAGQTISTRVWVNQQFVYKKPLASSFSDAACYMVFITAWYALLDIAQLRKGERVLIHSAAGGVGLAAIQIAKRVGAQIYATAGTAEKRKQLKNDGIEYVYDSRSLDFSDQIRNDTHGEGVDVVLNSLTGAALHASLELVRTGGRFIEIGKQDISAGSTLNLIPFNRSITFTSIDLDRLAYAKPSFFKPVGEAVAAAFARGELKPLKQHQFTCEHISDAFRLFATGNMSGKIVINLTQGNLEAASGFVDEPLTKQNCSYLVTGGLGGFGLKTAEWLVDNGAKHVVLVSRRQEPAHAEQLVINSMSRKGINVYYRSLDISQQAAVFQLIQWIIHELPPLAGVFHAAAVLEDQALLDIREEELLKVLAPKAMGAKHLHDATLHLPLDHFVVYSSVSVVVGNSHQGAYCLASGYLDGLIALRRSQGKVGTSVRWGAIDDVGMLERNAGTHAHLRRLGFNPMPSLRALEVFKKVRSEDFAHIGIFDVNWSVWKKSFFQTSWKRLEELVEVNLVGIDSPLEQLRHQVMNLDEENARALVVSRLTHVVARVFQMNPDVLEIERPLKEYGLDSLMTIQMQNSIEQAIGVTIPITELITGRSILTIAEKILSQNLNLYKT